MKYYENEIYPVALVLSHDVESVDEHYYNANDSIEDHITVKPTAEATTMFLTRRTKDYFAMAVGIIFNKENVSHRIAAHEGFHATRMIAEIGCHIYLSDYSEEAWAYLNGWVMDCVYNYLQTRNDNPKK